MKHLSRFLLKIFGWKIISPIPEDKKCIVIAAPHTSNWDFVLGWLYYKSQGKSVSVMIKEDLFIFPLGILLKWMNAIPVDRKPGNRMIEKVANEIKQRKEIHLAIAPEGTRSKVKVWKKGFLLIARRADLPVYLSYADYQKKVVGFLGVYHPSDDTSKDLKEVQAMYKGVHAKFPENFATE